MERRPGAYVGFSPKQGLRMTRKLSLLALLCLLLPASSLPSAGAVLAFPALQAPLVQPVQSQPPPASGPFVDPPEAYPHEPTIFSGDLRASTDPRLQQPVPSQPLLLLRRFTPGEGRK